MKKKYIHTDNINGYGFLYSYSLWRFYDDVIIPPKDITIAPKKDTYKVNEKIEISHSISYDVLKGRTNFPSNQFTGEIWADINLRDYKVYMDGIPLGSGKIITFKYDATNKKYVQQQKIEVVFTKEGDYKWWECIGTYILYDNTSINITPSDVSFKVEP